MGWVGMPFMAFVEWASPIVEVSGYAYMIVGLALGWVDLQVMGIFLFVAIGFGTLLSVMGLVLEEMSFKVYSRAGQALKLFAAALLENLGFRQMMSVFRLIGIFQWLFGRKPKWGEMQRQAPWSPGAAETVEIESEPIRIPGRV